MESCKFMFPRTTAGHHQGNTVVLVPDILYAMHNKYIYPIYIYPIFRPSPTIIANTHQRYFIIKLR